MIFITLRPLRDLPLRPLREPKMVVSQSFTKVFDFITELIQDLTLRSNSDNTFFEDHREIWQDVKCCTDHSEL